MKTPWHATLLSAFQEAIETGWVYAAQEGEAPVELAALVMDGPPQVEPGPYLLLGNQIVNAKGRVCARLTRQWGGPPRVTRRRRSREGRGGTPADPGGTS